MSSGFLEWRIKARQKGGGEREVLLLPGNVNPVKDKYWTGMHHAEDICTGKYAHALEIEGYMLEFDHRRMEREALVCHDGFGIKRLVGSNELASAQYCDAETCPSNA